MQSGKRKSRINWLFAGIMFAFLWASASTATKIGLAVAQPLVIAVVRFGIAAMIMLVTVHLFMGKRMPSGKEWGMLAMYGLLNITIYLGSYVIAMQHVTAGIGSLSIASNPVFISFLSVFFLNKKMSFSICIAIFLGTCGVTIAAWPLFNQASVTTSGLIILFFSMLSYSAGAIYFSTRNWNGLDLLTINAWQTFIGGLLLLPVALFFYDTTANHFNLQFWYVVLWLAIPVSIIAVQFWLWLLKINALKASLWLFLCPVFGITIAAFMMKERISVYTILGLLLVILGLFISQKNKVNSTNKAVE